MEIALARVAVKVAGVGGDVHQGLQVAEGYGEQKLACAAPGFDVVQILGLERILIAIGSAIVGDWLVGILIFARACGIAAVDLVAIVECHGAAKDIRDPGQIDGPGKRLARGLAVPYQLFHAGDQAGGGVALPAVVVVKDGVAPAVVDLRQVPGARVLLLAVCH